MPSWAEIKGKVKEAHDTIEAAFNQVESEVEKVKKHKALNTAVKVALPNIPFIGSYLLDWYNSVDATEEDKAKDILQFLKDFRQQNEEQFKRIFDDLKINLNTIIENKIEISMLIDKTLFFSLT